MTSEKSDWHTIRFIVTLTHCNLRDIIKAGGRVICHLTIPVVSSASQSEEQRLLAYKVNTLAYKVNMLACNVNIVASKLHMVAAMVLCCTVRKLRELS